jgi:hypothetical protein
VFEEELIDDPLTVLTLPDADVLGLLGYCIFGEGGRADFFDVGLEDLHPVLVEHPLVLIHLDVEELLRLVLVVAEDDLMPRLLGALALSITPADVEDGLSEAVQAVDEDGPFRHPNYNYQCGTLSAITRARRRPRATAA